MERVTSLRFIDTSTLSPDTMSAPTISMLHHQRLQRLQGVAGARQGVWRSVLASPHQRILIDKHSRLARRAPPAPQRRAAADTHEKFTLQLSTGASGYVRDSDWAAARRRRRRRHGF